MSVGDPLRVLVIEDDPVVRARVVADLRARPGTEVVGEAARVDAARALLARGAQLAVLDLRLEDGLALGLIPEAVARGARVVVLTTCEDEDVVFRALASGASGYVLKGDPRAGVVDALDAVLAGGAPISPAIARRLLDRLCRPERAAVAELTSREREVADHFSRGATYDQVASALGISVNTVRCHVRKMYEKLHVASKAELVAQYLRAR